MSTKSTSSLPAKSHTLGRVGLLAVLFALLTLVTGVGVSFASWDGPHSVADVTAYDLGRWPALAAPMGRSTIGDYVWHDSNADGYHDFGTPDESEFNAGIASVAMELWHYEGGVYVPDPSNPTTTTDATGKYSFGATAENNQYAVRIAPSNFNSGGPLDGYVFTSGTTFQVEDIILPGLFADYKDADFGYARASIEVTKSPATQTLLQHSTATFTINVKNTGEVPLSDVQVTDPGYISCDNTIPTLAVGQTVNYICHVTDVLASFDNVAHATGTPVNNLTDLKPLPGSTPEDDSNVVHVVVVTPAIDVEKYVSVDGKAASDPTKVWQDADTVTGPVVNAGTDVQFKFVVTNTGDVALSDVTLADNLYAIPAGCMVTSLAVGASDDCYITATWAAGQHTNQATTSGSFKDDSDVTKTVSDTDDANYFGAQPAIDVKKYVSVDGKAASDPTKVWQDANTVTGPVVNAGTDVQFKFVVTNTGNVALSGVTLADNLYAIPAGCMVTSLAVGASDDCYITATWAVGQHTNQATTNGTYKDENDVPVTVSDTDDANYFGAQPAIDVKKYVSVDGKAASDPTKVWQDANTVTGPVVNAGTDVQFKFVATNTGNVALSGVTLADNLYAIPAGCMVTSLAVGASDDCYITATWAAGQHTNQATTNGTYTDENDVPVTVSDTDDANYFGAQPAIDVEKYVSVDGKAWDDPTKVWQDADTVTGPFTTSAVNPQFKFVVTNTGNVALLGVTLADNVYTIPAGCMVTSLAVGASDDCYITATWAAGQHTNTATTNGTYTDDNNAPKTVSDTDDANYFGAGPAIKLIKTAGDAPNGTNLIVTPPTPVSVEYTYLVQNTGDVPLGNIVVTDNLLGTICTIAGPLAPAESTTCKTTAPISADTQNVGTATGWGLDAGGNPFAQVQSQDDAVVLVRGLLGDYVWWDVNGNGIQEAGEPGIDGVDLTLGARSTTTSGGGAYQFDELSSGLYTVGIPASEFAAGGTLDGFTRSSALVGGDTAKDSNGVAGSGGVTQATVNLPAYTSDFTIDFGFVKPTSYTLTKTRTSAPVVSLNKEVVFEIVIKNTGSTWITTLPVSDDYDKAYLTYGFGGAYATPASDNNDNDGTLNWTDLTGAGMLAPDGELKITLHFTSKADTTPLSGKVTINTAQVLQAGTVVDADGSGPMPSIGSPVGDLTAQDVVQIVTPTGVTMAGAGAVANADGVLVSWQTADESQVLGFIVLRGTTGDDLAQIGEFVPAARAGTSGANEYGFMDVPVAGQYVYALEVIGLDGTVQRIELGPVAFGQ